MSRYEPVIILIFCIAFFIPSALVVKSQQSEIETLIKDVSVDTQKGAIFGYTYMMKFTYDKPGKIGFGRKFTRLYEAILPTRFSLKRHYSHPFVLINDSERTITAEDIAAMRRDLVKELERAESEDDGQNTEEFQTKRGGYWTMSFSSNGKGVGIDILVLLKNAKLSNLQRKQIDNRNIVLIDFSPNTEASLEKSFSYLNKIEGQIWIDEAGKRVIRIEGFPLGKFEENKGKSESERLEHTAFLFIQTKVAEGFWFPKDVVLNFTKNPEIFEPFRIEFSFTDYRRSAVEIKSSEIETPKAVQPNEQ
jgi:hypothetical protein